MEGDMEERGKEVKGKGGEGRGKEGREGEEKDLPLMLSPGSASGSKTLNSI